MTNGRLIALTVISLLLEGAVRTQPLSAKHQSRDNERFEALFNEWRSLNGANSEKSSAADSLPSCYSIRDIELPPTDPNWAAFYIDHDDSEITSSFIETKSIKNCEYNDQRIAIFWEKSLFKDRSYFLRRYKLNCETRERDRADRSWLYSTDGGVGEIFAGDGFKDPIPVSAAFKLMKFVCDDHRDIGVQKVPQFHLEWEGVGLTNGDVIYSILRNDIIYSTSMFSREEMGVGGPPTKSEATFWVRRDYSNAKWTKYRYVYSRDTINCQNSTYSLGKAFAFLPGQEFGGEEVNLRSMRNIASNSNEYAIMRQVCNF